MNSPAQQQAGTAPQNEVSSRQRQWRRLVWMPTLGRHADLLVAFFLMIAVTNIAYLFASPVVLPGLAWLDHSWAFDLVVKIQQRVWLGDDVLFTYGPLIQFATGVFPNLFGGSLGDYFRSGQVVFSWAAIVFTFLTARILLGGHAVWKRSFYLLLMIGFWTTLDMRFCFDFFALAMALRYFSRAGESTRFRWADALLMAALILMGFLISTDTGMYALAAFVIAGASQFFVGDKEREARRRTVTAAVSAGILFAILAALLSVVMHGGMSFWGDSFAIVSQYRWSMAGPLDRPVKWRMVAIVAVAVLTLSLGWRWSNSRARSLSRQPAFFPAAILFSLLTLQSAIVRPDWGHVWIALIPSIAFCGLVLMGSEATERWDWRGDLPPLCALLLTAIFSGPAFFIVPKHFLGSLRFWSVGQTQTCPARTYYIDGVCMTRTDYEPLRAGSEYLRTHSQPTEAVAIFPFENVYADVARRRVAGSLLQHYIALDPRLARRQVEGLERHRPPVAIFSADGLGTFQVDGVPNFTRTPQVWFYFQRSFKQRAELAPGVFGLERDEGRSRRVHFETTPLVAPASYRSARHQRSVELSLSSYPVLTDFFRIRMRVNYPFWWRFRKPTWITVNLRYADATEKTHSAVLPPNVSADLWIYPGQDQFLANYFHESEAEWRKGARRSKLTSVNLTFSRMDDMSVVPSNVSVESVEAVLLRLR